MESKGWMYLPQLDTFAVLSHAMLLKLIFILQKTEKHYLQIATRHMKKINSAAMKTAV